MTEPFKRYLSSDINTLPRLIKALITFYIMSQRCSCSAYGTLYWSPWKYTNLNAPEATYLICAWKKRSLLTELNALFDFHPSNQRLSLCTNIYGALTSGWPGYGFFLTFFPHFGWWSQMNGYIVHCFVDFIATWVQQSLWSLAKDSIQLHTHLFCTDFVPDAGILN